MPNWCYNTLEVYGSKEDRKRFVDAVTTSDGWRLANLVPMPVELEGTESPTPSSPEPHENWAKLLANGEISQEWHDELVARNIARYEAGKVAKAATGYTDWYDWANSVWGTKWGDCDTELSDYDNPEWYEQRACEVFRYRTAWGPFYDSFWVTVAERFPTLGFVVYCSEESNAFLCCWGYANGECISFEETELPYSELFEQIEDDEERWEKINDWEHDWLDTRATEAAHAVSQYVASPIGG